MNIVACFESWQNGGLQLSPLYLESRNGKECIDRFIEGNIGSFASLHTFSNEVDAVKEYFKMLGEPIEHRSWAIGGGVKGTNTFINEIRTVDTQELIYSWTEYDISQNP